MEGFSNMWEGIKSAFSSMGEGLSNLFSGFGGGGGGGGFSSLFGGGASSSPINTQPTNVAPPSLSSPGFAPPVYGPQRSQGITEPQDQTNIFRNTSVQNRTYNAIGHAIQRGADSIGGLTGQVVGTIGRGAVEMSRAGAAQEVKIAAAQEREARMRYNADGVPSYAPPGHPTGPTPNARGQFAVAGGSHSERLIQAKEAGMRTMGDRIGAEVQTEVMRHILPPASNNGAFFDKLFGRR